jgi:hypothetical protein
MDSLVSVESDDRPLSAAVPGGVQRGRGEVHVSAGRPMVAQLLADLVTHSYARCIVLSTLVVVALERTCREQRDRAPTCRGT